MPRMGVQNDVREWRHRTSIAVPLHLPHRQDLLREEWSRRLGHIGHVRNLRLPTDGPTGVYRTRVDHRLIGDVAVSRQYSDPIEGVSGLGRGDLVAVHIIESGRLTVEDAGRRVGVAPGVLCIRDLQVPWEFAYTEPTRTRVLILPRAALIDHLGRTPLPALTTASATAPESRLLLAHLDTAWALSEQLGPAGTQAASAALAMLLTALISTHHIPAPAPPQALHTAATAYADSRLRDTDLSPATIAQALNVSVRTLHRAFADGESVMGYVRRSRLRAARRELDQPDSPYTVAEAAARWGFADPSHFRRAYRAAFGRPPRGPVRP